MQSAFAGICIATTTASAATCSHSSTAPVVSGFDIAQFSGLPGDFSNVGKWWATGTSHAGQTFTPPTNVLFRAITLRTGTGSADPGFIFDIRVSTISNNVLTVLRSESATWTSSASSAGSYLTFTLDTPLALTGGTVYAVDVQFSNSSKPFDNNIPYLYHHSPNPYTGGSAYTFATGATSVTLSSTRDYTFHLDISHLQTPIPDHGSSIPAGNVNLGWTNLPPSTGTDVWVDVWFGTHPASLTKIVDAGLNTTSTSVSVSSTVAAYYWRVDSYLGGAPTGSPTLGDVFYFIPDTDNDGLPDSYELTHTTPSSNISLNTGDDLDADGLTNLQEYQRGTGPLSADTDNDGLNDGVESNTGTWVSASNTGTNPLIADTDTDGLNDGVESKTGTWVSASNTGTNPLIADTDVDGLNDGVESKTGIWVSALNTGTNPLIADTDTDGLKDGVETNTANFVNTTSTGTSPHNPDTDADGAGDWYEVIASFTNPNSTTEKPNIPYPLPDPDSSAGATNKPVKVYIMSGQSNMVGMGTVTGTALGTLDTITKREKKFPNLLNSSNGWTKRQDVLYMGLIADAWTGDGKLTVADSLIGPELGFGHVMGYYHDEPVLLIKSSQGGRALGWDYRPPGSPRFDYTDGYTYAAYGESPDRWLTGAAGPTPFVWYAGKQYDDCFLDEADMGATAWAIAVSYPASCQVRHNGAIYLSKSVHTSAVASEPGLGAEWTTYWSIYSITNVVDILDNFATQYPSWAPQGFEIAGFVWWQGNYDFTTPKAKPPYPVQYEASMVRFIKQLRGYYSNRYPGKCSTTTPFVLATGCGDPQTSGDALVVANAQLAVSNPAKHPEFSSNVKTMDTRNYWRIFSVSPANSGSHYNNNAETYMLTGDALARGMIDLREATFAAWMIRYGVPPELIGFSQDADGDGIKNGVENFFGTAPNAPSGGLVFGVTSGNTFTFTHPQNATPAAGVTASYRWSKDLTTFQGNGTTDGAGTSVSFSTTTNAGITTVTATVSGAPTANLFVDCKVNQN